jgi:hypothetical protein
LKNNQDKSTKQFQTGINKIASAFASPFVAGADVVTAKGTDKITKPASRLMAGAGSLVSGLVDLSMSFESSMAKANTNPQKPTSYNTTNSKQKSSRPSLASFPQHRAKYASLMKPVEIEVPKQPNEPTHYWATEGKMENSEGETVLVPQPYDTLKCHQAHCEGSGEFDFTHAQAENFRQYGNSQPKACDPCKFWRYYESLKGNRNEPCEACGKEVYVCADYNIMYHKNIGKPLVSNNCGCVARAKAQADRDKQLSNWFIGLQASAEEGCKSLEFSNSKNLNPNKTDYHEAKKMFDSKKALAAELINLGISKPLSKELPSDAEFYRNKKLGSNSTQYDHLWKHIDGREDGDFTMKRYRHPTCLIDHAHSIAHIHDPKRFVEFETYKDHLKFDLERGELFIFNILSEPAYLRSAYVPTTGSMGNEDKNPDMSDPVTATKVLRKIIENIR